jgi:hypothetical protein
MTNHIIKLETGHIKLSDVGFLKYSINFFEAENDLKKTEKKHNPVPYFLLCKSIELSLKAYLLFLDFSKKQLKEESLGHNIYKLLEKVEEQEESIISLNKVQKENLIRAEIFYGNKTKSFEYFNIDFAAHGFEKITNSIYNNIELPDIKIMRKIAKELIEKTKRHMNK